MSKATAQEPEKCAVFLKALGEPSRLRIIRALASGPLTVSDIALVLEMDMAHVSHHLRVLFHSGITVTRREGKYVYYSINPEICDGHATTAKLDFGCCTVNLMSPPDA